MTPKASPALVAESDARTGSPEIDVAPAAVPEKGLDIFKMAGKTISGWLPYEKTGITPVAADVEPFRKALPYSTIEERDAALLQAFHPMVAYTMRADIKASFAKAWRLDHRLRLPFTIPYRFDGKDLNYYIDWVGVLSNGCPYGIEASVEELKADAQAAAKLEAADRYFRLRGGWFGLFVPGAVSDVRIFNLRRLNAHLRSFAGYDEIEPEITSSLLGTEPISIHELVAALAERFGEELVIQATWRRIALAATEGRLLVDLDAVLLDHDTPLQLLPPDMSLVLPPALPVSIEELRAARPPVEPIRASLLPGPTVDVEMLPVRHRQGFVRNVRIVLSALNGATVEAVAKEEGLSTKQVDRLIAIGQTEGEEGLIPYRHRHKKITEMDPVFIEPIRKLLHRKDPKTEKRLTYVQITESHDLLEVARKVEKDTGKFPTMPSYWQVVRLCNELLAEDKAIRDGRSGLLHVPHSATSVKGYVAALPSPAIVCQVDEHWMDVFVVTDEGAQLTERVHAAVLICAKTGAILGAVLSPRALTEEDYLRLIKQAMEPKDAITRRFKCINDWPCYGRPAEILSDQGKIVTSKHGTTVLVDRFGINQSFAPPYAPSVKGVVEALFRWITERFSHRLEGTTNSSPTDRGAYDSQAAALRNGITFTDFEELFYRAIVDGYMQDRDTLRGQPHDVLWLEAVERFGVPQWMGSSDELKLLLMRSWNPKHKNGLYHVQGAGVSFKGNWYVGEEGLTARLRDGYVRVYYDRRDIGTIYLVDVETGDLLGAAHCPEYADRRISEWEQAAERKANKPAQDAAHAESSANLTAIEGDAKLMARERKRLAKEAAKAASRGRFLDGQQEEIHTDAALAERRRLAEQKKRGPAWQTDPSLLPGPDPDDTDDVVVPLVRRRVRPEIG